jgi:Resolvase, N terminal domain
MRRLNRHVPQLHLFRPDLPGLAPPACGGARESDPADGTHTARAGRPRGQTTSRREDARMSDKIKPHHLGRKAILYVRQSSAHRVMHNRESRILQYAMRDRLRELGWHGIEGIDDDLGRSAAGSVTRIGFERMVAEVCLGKFGAVAAREISRFARNSRDWHQRIEMCRVVNTCSSIKRRPVRSVRTMTGSCSG